MIEQHTEVRYQLKGREDIEALQNILLLHPENTPLIEQIAYAKERAVSQCIEDNPPILQNSDLNVLVVGIHAAYGDLEQLVSHLYKTPPAPGLKPANSSQSYSPEQRKAKFRQARLKKHELSVQLYDALINVL